MALIASSKQKNLAIGGVAVLILLGGVFYLASKQTSAIPQDSQTITPATLVDGSNTAAWLGTYHASPIVNGMKSYTSERLGISFKYPSDYVLFEHEGDGVSFDGSINIAREDLIHEALNRKFPGEGPPSTGFTFYKQPDKPTSLEEWIRTDSRANFVIPGGEQENTLTPTTIGGVPAFTYKNFGLYSYDTAAFKYKGWIVVAASARMDDTRPNDFFAPMLSSVQLKP